MYHSQPLEQLQLSTLQAPDSEDSGIFVQVYNTYIRHGSMDKYKGHTWNLCVCIQSEMWIWQWCKIFTIMTAWSILFFEDGPMRWITVQGYFNWVILVCIYIYYMSNSHKCMRVNREALQLHVVWFLLQVRCESLSVLQVTWDRKLYRFLPQEVVQYKAAPIWLGLQ